MEITITDDMLAALRPLAKRRLDELAVEATELEAIIAGSLDVAATTEDDARRLGLSVHAPEPPPARRKRRPPMTAAQRKAASVRMKKRWAQWRAASQNDRALKTFGAVTRAAAAAGIDLKNGQRR